MHIAVESGKPAVVETLLGYGADLHVRGGKLRETPLHIASRVKDGDRCALMLLKSGGGPNLATDDGQTPVHVAAKNGNLQTLILLLEDGGDAMWKSNVSIFFLIIYQKSFFLQELSYIYWNFKLQLTYRMVKRHFIWPVVRVNLRLYSN